MYSVNVWSFGLYAAIPPQSQWFAVNGNRYNEVKITPSGTVEYQIIVNGSRQ